MRTWVMVLALVACTGGPGDTSGDDTADSGDPGEMLGIGLSPNGPVANVGEQVQFVAKAFYADTSNEDVTAEMSWQSTDTRVATVDASGKATALAEGLADIVATDDGGVSAKVRLTVKAADATPTGLQLSPPSLLLAVGQSVEMSAIAEYADGSGGNVGASCTWSSDAAGTVAMQGATARGVATGTTTVRAACPGGLSASVPATVSASTSSLPDLRVVDGFAEASGTTVQVLAEIENRGGSTTSGFAVDLYLDPANLPAAGDPRAGTVWVAGLAPSQTLLVLVEVEGVAPGDHALWVVADASQRIEETNESDNVGGPWAATVAGAGGGPQLRVATFEGLSDGLYTYWDVEIENAGTETARDFFVDLWFDEATDPGFCAFGDLYLWVPELAAGASTWWYPEVEDGPFTTWASVAVVDTCDDVDESDEADNLSRTTIAGE